MCLFVSEAGIVGPRIRGLREALLHAAEGPLPDDLALRVRDPIAIVASWTNTGLAVGIVFVMVTKPSLAGSLAALSLAAASGALVGAPHRWSRSPGRRSPDIG